jgi:lipopolysaccharide/colanic/teichoic acid biosynthesis glycosyltransferase
MDLLFVVLAAPVAALLIAGLGIAILLVMGPPVFFVQDRTGLGGRIFRMYKLRTMQQSTRGKAVATAKNDPRITPLGRFLRVSHLDELPQLWNIFSGEMSLIGPRPEQPQLVEAYRTMLPDYDLRHSVVPGLTGWAQVNCDYAADVEETRAKLAYDLHYIRNVGPALDLKIFLRTFVVCSSMNYVR